MTGNYTLQKGKAKEAQQKVTYNSLKVWDANNKELAAKFTVNKKHTALKLK